MLWKNIGDNEQADCEEQIAADRSEDLSEIVLVILGQMVQRELRDMEIVQGTWMW